jgi:hypothetical protein
MLLNNWNRIYRKQLLHEKLFRHKLFFSFFLIVFFFLFSKSYDN